MCNRKTTQTFLTEQVIFRLCALEVLWLHKTETVWVIYIIEWHFQPYKTQNYISSYISIPLLKC